MALAWVSVSAIRRNPLTQEVLARLLPAIRSGEGAGGAPRPKTQTAIGLGVHRVPVRKARVGLGWPSSSGSERFSS